jgi:hypothetical protein
MAGSAGEEGRSRGRPVDEGPSLGLWLGVLLVGTLCRVGPLVLGGTSWVAKRYGVSLVLWRGGSVHRHQCDVLLTYLCGATLPYQARIQHRCLQSTCRRRVRAAAPWSWGMIPTCVAVGTGGKGSCRCAQPFILPPLSLCPSYIRTTYTPWSVCRCVALVKQEISPYSGSICHEAPVTVRALVLLDRLEALLPVDDSSGQVRTAPCASLVLTSSPKHRTKAVGKKHNTLTPTIPAYALVLFVRIACVYLYVAVCSVSDVLFPHLAPQPRVSSFDH